jgi:molecular chaperone DnaK
MNKVIGIDLGTGVSCVSVYENGNATVIPNQEGQRTTPSVIALKGGDRKVGATAKRQQVVNPKETVYIIKRFMGLKYDDKDCQNAIKHVTYDIVNDNGNPRVLIEGRKYSPEELSSYIINYMKKVAEDYLGEKVTDAIITCPAYFNNEQREATKLAGEMAGLIVLRIISEPTAALLASNLDLKTEKKILVADVGSGTTDFSVAEVSNELIEIKASDGDMFLGGSDFDLLITNWLIEEAKSEYGVDLSKDVLAKQRLLEAAEKAKIELSSTVSTEINLPYITSTTESGPIHLVKTLTRAKFEQLISSNVDEIIKHAKKVVKDANLKPSDLDGILLVGGSCRIPLIQERLEKEVGVQLYKNLNFDECISQGACIQGSIITGENKSDLLLLDVTPLSLGIETLGGVFTTLVPANTTIPCKKSQIFSTASDNQNAVSILVGQGERPLFVDNKLIGQFNLDNIPPAKRGVPQIEVSFDIDVNGLLKVGAIDKGTGKDSHITIQQKGNLSQDEIERIKSEAKQFEAQDKIKKEKIEKINQADTIAFQTKKQVEDLENKITDEEKKSILESVEKLENAIKEQRVDEFELLEKEIQDKFVPITSRLYQQSNPNASNGPDFMNDFMKQAQQNGGFPGGFNPGGTSSKTPGDQTEDVEFEEVK